MTQSLLELWKYICEGLLLLLVLKWSRMLSFLQSQSALLHFKDYPAGHHQQDFLSCGNPPLRWPPLRQLHPHGLQQQRLRQSEHRYTVMLRRTHNKSGLYIETQTSIVTKLILQIYASYTFVFVHLILYIGLQCHCVSLWVICKGGL